MIPARIFPLETLPLTSNGKVDRQALPQPLIQPPEHTRNLSAARTPTEQALVHLWSEILNQNHVGIEENFLKLGGDSLLATKLLARIRADFNIEVPFQVLFKNPTVAALAEAIEQAHAQTATVAVEEEEGVL
jgi:aryl carrier-like protein